MRIIIWTYTLFIYGVLLSGCAASAAPAQTVDIGSLSAGDSVQVDGLIFDIHGPMTNPTVAVMPDGRRCEVAGDTLEEVAANVWANNTIRCEE